MRQVPDNFRERLPHAIWMPGGDEICVYRGSPVEMVGSMAQEMGVESPREAVVRLLHGLSKSRGINIGLPANATDERLSALFVYALLDTRLARVVPTA